MAKMAVLSFCTVVHVQAHRINLQILSYKGFMMLQYLFSFTGIHGLTIDACHRNQPKKSYITSVVYAVNLL